MKTPVNEAVARALGALVAGVLLAGIAAGVLCAGPLCTLIADAATGQVRVEQGDCTTRTTPASTFKVALAVMAYDIGLLTDAHHPVFEPMPDDTEWGGATGVHPIDPTEWMHQSVVWVSQRLARAMGAATLTRYARAFRYGNADFSGDAGLDNGLSRAWLGSSLQISPAEQVAFLRALVTDGLPVRPDAMASARALVEVRALGGWRFHGKTGAAFPRRADRSFDRAHGWGWYVGWAEGDGHLLVFARLVQDDTEQAVSPGLRARDELLDRWISLISP